MIPPGYPWQGPALSLTASTPWTGLGQARDQGNPAHARHAFSFGKLTAAFPIGSLGWFGRPIRNQCDLQVLGGTSDRDGEI